MRKELRTRLAVTFGVCAIMQFCALDPLLAQSPIAASSPSKPSAALPLSTTPFSTAAPATQAASLPPAQRPARRAEISFVHGNLAVAADNASLNQILREIARLTGIAITGGVAEERVFGKYGPSPAPDVLASLLDGTESNMLLIPEGDGLHAQLILTPRHGGPTPPNPNAPGFDDEGAGDNDAVQRFRPPNPTGVSLYGESPAVQGAPPNGVPAGTGTDPSNPANATNPQSPNGIKTPQEIMQQLQMLRQQQQQTQPQP